MAHLLAFAFLAVLAVLRHVLGGYGSGVGVLMLLPVVWIALHGTRSQLAAMLGAVALFYVGPALVIGGAAYPPAVLRLTVVCVGVATIIGVIVQRLVTQVRDQAEQAAQRERDLETIARVARTLTGDDARDRICEALCEVSGAAFAILFEPDGEGRLHTTAISGVDLAPATLDPGREVSTTFVALTSRQRIFVADADGHPAMNPTLWAAAGRPASMLFEPVMDGDACVGVAVVGWARRLDAGAGRASAVVALLTAEAAVAIARADLVARLSEQALTDPLTGLANRRVWEKRLEEGRASAARTGSPLTVAVIDLDGFKQINDEGGHERGDRILKECAATWARELRAGDTLARVGGDEFALVLPGCSPPAAAETLDRLRAASPAGLTFSAGTAGWREVDTTATLTARADAALYAAKLAGRARTSSATP